MKSKSFRRISSRQVVDEIQIFTRFVTFWNGVTFDWEKKTMPWISNAQGSRKIVPAYEQGYLGLCAYNIFQTLAIENNVSLQNDYFFCVDFDSHSFSLSFYQVFSYICFFNSFLFHCGGFCAY